MFPKYLEPCRGLVMISGYSRFSGLENKFKNWRYLGGENSYNRFSPVLQHCETSTKWKFGAKRYVQCHFLSVKIAIIDEGNKQLSYFSSNLCPVFSQVDLLELENSFIRPGDLRWPNI